ncbi:regulator of G-protein signaling 22-like [Xenia sp. Carnegie-2017]|uniref:regulator of G-protein signaling 22-like n=1 Tax=Xenia sp. Carnegie-2017 TaxID=2897299 RepID=UPI001F040CA7|nr:regulator of G-protein signaling 22-like [Xenia sp. Carnegie-2017]
MRKGLCKSIHPIMRKGLCKSIHPIMRKDSIINISKITSTVYFIFCPDSDDTKDCGNLFLLSITADRLAGGPFQTYLKSKNDKLSLAHLQFWEDVQTYIAIANSSAVDLKYRLGRNILVTYLQHGSIREIRVDCNVRERLCRLLQRCHADVMLSRIANKTIEVLYDPWQAFVQADKDDLKNTLLSCGRRGTVALEEALENNENNESFRVLRALDLALCLGMGDSQQVAVEEEDVLLSESDEEEFENEGSLRKRRLTIVNEEAAEALVAFFSDILSDSTQLLWLKRFLSDHGVLMPLKFWQDVERMKTQSKDSRARQAKARAIVKQYFANIEDPCRSLHCQADIIRDIPLIDHVTPAMLVSAQACVIRSLEEQWFYRYLATFPEDAKEEDLEKYAARNTLMGITKIASWGKTRGLWAVFGQSMMAFIRGVTKHESRECFIRFLVSESKISPEGRKHINQNYKRIINNRVISADHLASDLRFWLEVQRFKEMVDGASLCALAGNYSLDDEKLIRSKAKTIICCFLDSALPPRLQINIPYEMSDRICHEFNSGISDRGLFHDAEIYVFCTLINYWKKFLASDMKFDDGAGKEERKGRRKHKHKNDKETLYIEGIPYRRIAILPDEDSRLSFSLMTGLRIIS